VLLALAAGGPADAQTLEGVNLAGAAFAPAALPGVYGQDFSYPNDQEVAYFTRRGMNVFRLSLLWERLQPEPRGPLDPVELARLKTFIADARAHHAAVVIDIHNYGMYRGVLIGQPGVTAADFADLWRRIARNFRNDDHILFGLMNEPKQPDAQQWQAIVQAAIDAIRATGAANRILVSGIGWDSAAGFAATSGATLGHVSDPGHKLVFEVHEYFDADSSGTTADCVTPEAAVARLAAFTRWLEAEHRLGFLGEFGASRNPACLAVLDRVAAYLSTHENVWTGWTYWAAGPEWGDYMFTLEPDAGIDRPQMTILEKYLPPASRGLTPGTHG